MDLELFFQLINSIVLIAILYVFYYVIFKTPQKFKKINNRINEIENSLTEINKKLG